MVTKKRDIVKNIDDLDQLYNESWRSNRRQFFYAKLAVLEVCGWIEETMDDIVRDCSSRKITIPRNQNEINTLVKRNYGFEYEKHFRKMLMTVVGLSKIEQIEDYLNTSGQLSILQSKLEALKVFRNNFAHTTTRTGMIPNYNAPSVTKRDFLDIYNALREYEKSLKRFNC